jgi:2-iminobutanoate/2-iminopropanoate deaminase
MERSVIKTASAPAAIGPYSQAVVVPVGDRRMIFCSGQVALDPETGDMVGGGDVAAEARQVMDNITAVLTAAGATLGDVVKTTIFLADMNDFATVNRIYGERFSDAPPARSTIQAAGLPKNARVEIEVVAIGDR